MPKVSSNKVEGTGNPRRPPGGPGRPPGGRHGVGIIEIYGQDAPKPNIMLKSQVNNYDLKSIIINHLPLNTSFNNAYAFHSF